MAEELFLGLDLSTQQLKGIVVNKRLQHVYHAKVEFDEDLPQYKTNKGVHTNADLQEVQAPIVMWLDALDMLFARLKTGVNLGAIMSIGGACQQHGSVFWRESKLGGLDLDKTLKEQLEGKLAWQMSPNWQDHSTVEQCQAFENAAGGKEELAKVSGSKAHHRFTGPQILKLKTKNPVLYGQTYRIALVSSFLASVMLGEHAPLDIGDACGMNLWDVEKKAWDPKLLALLGEPNTVKEVLGPVTESGGPIGSVSQYFVSKYGVNPRCQIVPFTGDNPGTILSLPLEANDVIVSLGTSTTALVVTEKYAPSSLYHMFSHPVGKGFMGMLCYCNGALAREQIRDAVNSTHGTIGWDKFNELAVGAPVLANAKVGFYFPLSEIIPDTPSTTKRLSWGNGDGQPRDDGTGWDIPDDDARAILESQALSIRYRLGPMLTTQDAHPRRIYFVGGASANPAICKVYSQVLVPEEGSFTLDLTDACAMGAAHKAAYGLQNKSWEEFITENWGNRCDKVPGTTNLVDEYRDAVDLFVKSESYL